MKSKLVCAIGAVIALCSGSSLFPPAKADVFQTFDVEWSGASLGNSAAASALITFDLTTLPNPHSGVAAGALIGPVTNFITALSLTVSGAGVGNGTFGLSDFSPGSSPGERQSVRLVYRRRNIGLDNAARRTIDPWRSMGHVLQRTLRRL